MKIAFDITPLGDQNKERGVGSYTYNLLKELRKITDIELIEFQGSPKGVVADLVHYPYFDLFKSTLPIKKSFPTVVTIHDLTPLVFPEFYPPGIKGMLHLYHQKMAIRSAASIITDSESSKKDIAKILKIPGERMEVVYLAASSNFHKIDNQKVLFSVKQKFNLPDRFGLYVGNINWNKNLINLTQACLDCNLDIVLVGKSFKTHDLNHPELKSFNVFLGKYKDNPLVHILDEYIESDELVVLYNLADLTLLPSYYEGFGIPILESQGCGTPVITSNLASMMEISGDSAVLVDPYYVTSICQGIQKLLNDRQYKQMIIKKGLENFQKYSWQKTAKETAKIYAKVIS